jgi:hypothetical protein
MRRSRALPILWLAVLGLSPAPVNSQPRPYSVRDSAGLAIVENRTPVWQPGHEWRFGASPNLQIGRVDGDSSLHLTDIRAATRLSDGRIAIAQPGHVRVFGADGRFLRYLGSAGRGPGEFTGAPTQLRVLPGDSLGAATVGGPELIFDERGAFVRAVSFRSEGLVAEPNMVARSTLIGDGTRMLTVGPRQYLPRPQPGIFRPRTAFMRFDPLSLRLDTLGWFHGMESVIEAVSERGGSPARPFPRNTLVTAGGDRVYVGDSDANTFFVFTTGTWSNAASNRLHREMPLRLRAIVRKPVTLEPVTAADRAAWFDRARAPFNSMQAQAATARNPERMRMEREFLEQGLANASWPTTKPAFAGLLADRVGNLWIQEHSRIGEPQRYIVIDREGRWLGLIAAPRGVTVLEIGDDYLLGVWKNEDDVEFLRVYSLIKG